jgi:hypothetical protein
VADRPELDAWLADSAWVNEPDDYPYIDSMQCRFDADGEPMSVDSAMTHNTWRQRLRRIPRGPGVRLRLGIVPVLPSLRLTGQLQEVSELTVLGAVAAGTAEAGDLVHVNGEDYVVQEAVDHGDGSITYTLQRAIPSG